MRYRFDFSEPQFLSFRGLNGMSEFRRTHGLAVDLSKSLASKSKLFLRDEFLLRKEVIQPQVPLRLPCYDFIPVTAHSVERLPPLRVGAPASATSDFHDVTGGVYKARERIHAVVADTALLAIPASWRRVAASNPNWAQFY